MSNSFQNEIPKARINLKLAVDKGDGKKKAELPLRMMVVGDYTFRPDDTRIADKEKISIDKNNFEDVMSNMNLSLDFTVDNKLSNNGTNLPISLKVDNMKSFNPDSIVQNTPALKKLIAARNLLKDLKTNIVDNREMRKRIESLIKDEETAKALHAHLSGIIGSEKQEENIPEDANTEE